MTTIPKPPSPGEESFMLQCRVYGLTPEREYRFHHKRRWRFDFAFPPYGLAIEIEGGTWNHGRHNRGSSIEKDFEKYNCATTLGWRVLRYSTAMVQDGTAIDQVLSLIPRKRPV